MSFTDQEYLEILRHLQDQLRQAEPDLYERLAESRDFDDSVRERSIRYLNRLIENMKERSGSSYSSVLQFLNESITTESGNPIDGIQVNLTSQERELYRREIIDLSELPDRSRLIGDLSKILNILIHDDDNNG